MILILSQEWNERSTEDVMDWLEHLGQPSLRVNGADFEGKVALSFQVSRAEIDTNLGFSESQLAIDQVKSVWFRRWEYEPRSETVDLFASKLGDNKQAELRLKHYLRLERQRLSDFFFSLLAEAAWLGSPSNRRQNKLVALSEAAKAGLDIPATLVTTYRDELLNFAARFESLITKPISDAEAFDLGDRIYSTLTIGLDNVTLEDLPPRFAPSLFQERLAKDYEIRVFFLRGECFSMAIFSQFDPQTQIDFRHYNWKRPNRCVPYKFPEEFGEAIKRLMNSLKLETGSLDFVKTADGRTVFLEVNPVGQFGMVSKPCNYYLEFRMAETLIEKVQNGTNG